MNGAHELYASMAQHWWDGLTESERESWLELAEIDGRERHPLAAFTLMGDLQHGYPADNAVQHCDEGR